MASLLIDTGGVSVYFPARELPELRSVLKNVEAQAAGVVERLNAWLDTIDTALTYECDGVEQGDVLEGVIEATVEARSVDDGVMEVGEA